MEITALEHTINIKINWMSNSKLSRNYTTWYIFNKLCHLLELNPVSSMPERNLTYQGAVTKFEFEFRNMLYDI